VAVRIGKPPIPANRAAKRLGYALGSLFFAGSAAALSTGYSTLGVALMLGTLAGFVATSNICVPSIVFTILWGEDQATSPALIAAIRQPLQGPAPELRA
jgi:hypothetical protein